MQLIMQDLVILALIQIKRKKNQKPWHLKYVLVLSAGNPLHSSVNTYLLYLDAIAFEGPVVPGSISVDVIYSVYQFNLCRKEKTSYLVLSFCVRKFKMPREAATYLSRKHSLQIKIEPHKTQQTYSLIQNQQRLDPDSIIKYPWKFSVVKKQHKLCYLSLSSV